MRMRPFVWIIVATYTVTATAPTAQLDCHSFALSITFNKTELDAHGRNYTIAFSGSASSSPVCKIISENSYGERIRLFAFYNRCGIKVVQEGDEIIYTQMVVVTYNRNSKDSLIQRKHDQQYHLRCKRARNFTESADTLDIERNIVGQITDKDGFAQFSVNFMRYTDSSFSKSTDKRNLKLGDMLYFGLNFFTMRSDIGMYPQDCYATKKDGSGKYFLLKDRCINSEDGTVKILSSPKDLNVFRWQMEAFRYFGNSDEVFFHCDILICVGFSASGCTRLCQGNNTRYRSDLTNSNAKGTTKKVAISSSPIVIADDKQDETPNNVEKREEKSIFSGTQGTIIISLIALLIAIVAAGITKKNFFRTMKPQMLTKGVNCSEYVK